MSDDQQDIDDAAEHQQQLDEQRLRFQLRQKSLSRTEPNSGNMDPRCFTTPMNWPTYDKVLKRWV